MAVFARPQIDLWYHRTAGPEGATPVLGLMGLGAHGDYWSPAFIETVSRERSFIAIDNRGAARSTGSCEGLKIATMADDVADLLDHLQISKIHLFGVSMGGMIALAFALRFPSRVETLTLGCTTARPRKFNLNPHMAQPIIDSLRQGGAVTPLLISQGFITANPELVAQFEQRIQQQIVAKNVLWEQIKACWNFDVSSRLQEIGAPTLIMTGDRDLIMPAACSQDLAAQIPQSTLRIFAGSGHAFILENQAEVLKLLSNHWLSRS